MNTKKINELPVAQNLGDTSVLPVSVNMGSFWQTFKLNLSALKSFLHSSPTFTGNVNMSSAAKVEVPTGSLGSSAARIDQLAQKISKNSDSAAYISSGSDITGNINTYIHSNNCISPFASSVALDGSLNFILTQLYHDALGVTFQEAISMSNGKKYRRIFGLDEELSASWVELA